MGEQDDGNPAPSDEAKPSAGELESTARFEAALLSMNAKIRQLCRRAEFPDEIEVLRVISRLT